MYNTHTITVKDVYRTDNPKIPEGYEVVKFGVITEGCFYLRDTIGTDAWMSCTNGPHNQPRLILRKIPKLPIIKFVPGPVRKLQYGDYWQYEGRMHLWTHTKLGDKDQTYTRIEEPQE